MHKRGQEGMPWIVVGLILALLVIGLMGWFIQQTIAKGKKTVTEIGKESELSGKKCASIILGQTCYDSSCTTGYKEISRPPGDWEDCKGKYCCAKE